MPATVPSSKHTRAGNDAHSMTVGGRFLLGADCAVSAKAYSIGVLRSTAGPYGVVARAMRNGAVPVAERVNAAGGDRRAGYDGVYAPFARPAERGRRRVGPSSGGRQRLAIARVTPAEPTPLLLDEPSGGIQLSVVQEIARTVVALNRQTGGTVVSVEQTLDMLRAVARRCPVMDKGRIVRRGSAAGGAGGPRDRTAPPRGVGGAA